MVRGRHGGRRGAGRATLQVCVTCRWRGLDRVADADLRPGRRLFDLVSERAGEALRGRIGGIVCLTHCPNACNAVAMQRGKESLLMTRMAPTEAAADAMLELLERYADSPTGEVPAGLVPAAIPVARPLVPRAPVRARRAGGR